MYSVKIANIDEFRNSKEIWNALVSKMAFPTIFCTWEWIYTWWEHFGHDYELIVLFVYKCDELKGILPLASNTVMFHNGWLTGRVLTYCGSMEVYPDHLDIIASSDEAYLCMDAIIRFLNSSHKKWDLIHLSLMPEENTLAMWIIKNRNLVKSTVQITSVSPFIKLNGNFNDYMQTFSGKQRHNIERLRNRLYGKYGVELCVCDRSYDVQAAFYDLFGLHLLRKQNQNVKSSFTGEQLLKFHVQLSRRCENNGWLRLVFLKKDGKAVAAGYGFVYNGRFSYYQSGFDLSWEKHSVGSTLLLELIKYAYKEELKEFDFLRGNEEYKKRWTEENRRLLSMTLYNKTVRGLISEASLTARNFIKKQLRHRLKQ